MFFESVGCESSSTELLLSDLIRLIMCIVDLFDFELDNVLYGVSLIWKRCSLFTLPCVYVGCSLEFLAGKYRSSSMLNTCHDIVLAFRCSLLVIVNGDVTDVVFPSTIMFLLYIYG